MKKTRFKFEDIDFSNIQEKPDKVGWYLIELHDGVIGNKHFDVDCCTKMSFSDGNGLGMVNWYMHNIKQCIFLHP